MGRPAGLWELLAAERQGVLATLSVRYAGWPFASLTPYATDLQGQPLLLLSELAEHTRKIRADPRASLLVQDSRSFEDPQAGARVTLLGMLARVADENFAQSRYVERHPQAADFLALGDFRLWVLQPTTARFVNGFGEMGWVDGDRLMVALRQT